ncbi:MazG nucleotide pyrophosphohydrolase domain-containing protein [Natronospora cellulosivora (SeqCode)]
MKKITLTDLQKLIHEKRKERGFVMDPIKIFTLLNEEIGEVAQELKKTWSINYEDFDKNMLSEEIADVQACLIALANQFDIDISSALINKFVEKDSKRVWKSAMKE